MRNIEIDGDKGRRVERAGEALARERFDDGDHSDDVLVEVRELLGGNPKFLVRAAPSDLHRLALRDDFIHFEPRDEAREP